MASTCAITPQKNHAVSSDGNRTQHNSQRGAQAKQNEKCEDDFDGERYEDEKFDRVKNGIKSLLPTERFRIGKHLVAQFQNSLRDFHFAD
jgi:hypothetical protein